MTTTVTPSRPMIAVPYVDLAAHDPALKAALLEATDRVLSHGQFILGEEVRRFEEQFSAYVGTRFAVGVANGTDALTLTLKAWGIGSGDEVITAPNSFLASASSVIFAGAKPVFVDVLDDYCMDPQKLKAAITKCTKAIIPVHLTGHPADIDAILSIAQEHGIPVLEDAAQAAGAKVGSKHVGSLGRAGSFSLHPLKNISACGDGGVITTNDQKLYEHLLLARNHGLKNRDECVFWSMNSRLDALHAALLSVKLTYLDEWNTKRREHAAFYQQHLADIVEVPHERAGAYAVYHTFVIQADRRDELQKFLEQRDIGTRVHYPVPIHLQEAAKSLGFIRGDFPITERQADRILSLPIDPSLTQAQREAVVGSIRAFYNAS